MQTISELNSYYKSYYAEIAERSDVLLRDPVIAQVAAADIHNDLNKPFQQQKQFYSALLDAERAVSITRNALASDELLRKQIIRESAKRAASAKRTNALQALIASHLAENPGASNMDVFEMLNRAARGGVVHDIEEGFIHWVDGGREKKTPVSALKHRISRERKKLKSR
jgi:hypothetical protein